MRPRGWDRRVCKTRGTPVRPTGSLYISMVVSLPEGTYIKLRPKFDLSAHGVQTDIEALLATAPRVAQVSRRSRQHPREQGPYIFRIPVAWMAEAYTVSSAAVMAALPVWYVRGLFGHRDVDLRVCIRKNAELFRLRRDRFRRGLLDLEKAGLISIHRGGLRQSPRISIIRKDLT